MSSISPEALLRAWLGSESPAWESAAYSEPFHVPYDRLARVDGWVVWLGHPPAPSGLQMLPLPEELLWGDPQTAIAAAMLVAADYAIRRGASDPDGAVAVLHRESPIVFVVPDALHGSLTPLLESAGRAGIPIARERIESDDALAGLAPSFAARRRAHGVELGRAHDPALSFQTHVPEEIVGGPGRGVLKVHAYTREYGVEAEGPLTPRFTVDIGLAGHGPADVAEVATVAAKIPSFLDRVSCFVSDGALAIGWRRGDAPDAVTIARAFHIWLRALTGADKVHVAITTSARTSGSRLPGASRES